MSEIEWKDLDEELPEPGDRVLIRYGDGQEVPGEVTDGAFALRLKPTAEGYRTFGFGPRDLECWLPLPDPPEPDPTEKLPGEWQEDTQPDDDRYYRQANGFRVDLIDAGDRWIAQTELRVFGGTTLYSQASDTPREAHDALVGRIRERFYDILDALEGANE